MLNLYGENGLYELIELAKNIIGRFMIVEFIK